MSKRYIKFLLFALLLAVMGVGQAQCPPSTTMGRDFWVMFMQNYFSHYDEASEAWIYSQTSLIAAVDGNTTIHVENPRTNWDTTVTVTQPGTVEIPIRGHETTCTRYGVSKGLHVTATRDISLYASNYMPYTFDIATVLPTDVLDTEYIVQTFAGTEPQVGFVATEDNTVLSMRLVCDRGEIYGLTGDSLSVTLQRGQSFLLRGMNFQTLSGMTVSSNGKPFALFQGNGCTEVPERYCSACDHLYEQTIPVRYWGKTFIVVPTAIRVQGDIVVVTSSADYCQVKLNGAHVCYLMEGQSRLIEVQSGPGQLLECSEPSYVCLYMKGVDCGGIIPGDTVKLGDPSSVTIPPIEQGVHHVRFNALATEISDKHYVNIALRTVDTAYMMLDGQPISDSFATAICGYDWGTPIPSEYSYAKIAVSPGMHTLDNSRGRFVAHFYGMGPAESYAYVAGMSVRDLYNRLYVNDIDVLDYTHDIVICRDDTTLLRVTTQGDVDSVVWIADEEVVKTGDTTLSLPLHEEGWHRIDAVLSDLCDTLTAWVRVVYHQTDTVSDSICAGNSYQFGNRWFYSAGEYSITVSDSYGCDSTTVLELSFVGAKSYEVYDTFCPNTAYHWNGVDYVTGGDYTDTLSGAEGCDSVVTLHLAELPRADIDISVEGDCESYHLNVVGTYSFVRWTSEPEDPMLAGHETEASLLIAPDVVTRYTVTADFSDDFSCPTETSVTISPSQKIQARMKVHPKKITTEYPSFEAYDISTGVTNRAWYVDGNLAGDSPHLHYTSMPKDDNVIVMLVVSNGQCSDTVTDTIHVVRISLWAPNAFTPDEETNKLFEIIGEGIMQGELYIYDRKGLLVCHRQDYRDGWDGKKRSKGGGGEQECPQGAYVWHLIYSTEDAPSIIKKATGTVTLLR